MKRAKKKKDIVSSTKSPVELEPGKGMESHKLVELEPASEKSTNTSGRQSGPFLEDSRSVEFKLVEALKWKEVEWQAWPKSFRASADAHSRY